MKIRKGKLEEIKKRKWMNQDEFFELGPCSTENCKRKAISFITMHTTHGDGTTTQKDIVYCKYHDPYKI